MAEDGKGKGVKEDKIAEDGLHFMEVDLPPLNDAQFEYLSTSLCLIFYRTIEDALDNIGFSRPERLIQERSVNSLPPWKEPYSLGERFVRIRARAMQRSERPRKKQKLEEEGESSAMGAANSTSTKDAVMLAFEQRLREVESQLDALKCAFEKEKAAHNDTMREFRALQHAVQAIPRQVTTEEPEACLLQDTTDEAEACLLQDTTNEA